MHFGVRTLLSPSGGSVVGVTTACIDFTAAVLFLLRRPPEKEIAFGPAIACLLSAGAGSVSLALAPPVASWHPAATTAFALGGLAAIASLVALGRSFAVLPSVRGLVRHGPYRLVRHPIYLAEASMVVTCTLAGPSPRALGAAAVALALLVVRIRIEERHLRTTAAYRVYAEDVRWRLLPGLW